MVERVSHAAFAWLDRAYEDRSAALVFVISEPQFDPLRDDPRFDELLARLGLQGAGR